ncbi:MAG: anhydro-N-acetylmuramic acid kinase [Chitinophagales bacterium]|nr:anhydro-N-acetylmuramic acid kinase [Chitinophagales bacterium]
MQQEYFAIGLMSGSSLDGLDLCYVHFSRKDNLWFSYQILATDCISYNEAFREKLKQVPNLTVINFAKLHIDLGHFFGNATLDFIQKHQIEKIDFIVSHGQTIFHQPQQHFSSQIGCGATIAQITQTKTISDLRMSDVAAGGQGAPIVPIAEKYLFPNYDIFLNIGGICNIAFHHKTANHILAYDVCAGNTLLNYLAQQKSKTFDEGGQIAQQGNVCAELLHQLNSIPFCSEKSPKSLGSEHIYQDWIALTDISNISIEDKMATCVEHIAQQIGNQINQYSTSKSQQLLVSGGGAFNTFLIQRIQNYTSIKVVVPDKATIEQKEALAIAFFGLLRILQIPNCISSVTGANKNVVGGAVYLP